MTDVNLAGYTLFKGTIQKNYAINLEAGIYQLTVTDAQLCESYLGPIRILGRVFRLVGMLRTLLLAPQPFDVLPWPCWLVGMYLQQSTTITTTSNKCHWTF